jgi:hypothetical protein
MSNIRSLLKITKILVLTVLLSGFALTVFGQTVSVRSENEWTNKPVDNAAMSKRIRDAAERYSEYAPIPRGAFIDIGFPKSKEEFEELNGYGILLLSALSQTESELPLKRVYVSVAGKEIELTLIEKYFSKESDQTGQVAKTFGSFRVDALYFFPVYLRKSAGSLMIDFAENRKGMKIAEFSEDMPDSVKNLPDIKPSADASMTDEMKIFLRREYPGYVNN